MGAEAKICGLTRASDAALAVRLGASYLGVVFAESPRRVTAAQARAVAAEREGRPLIGVFVSEPIDQILRLRDDVGLAAVQLHRSYGAEALARLASEGVEAWVARHIANGDEAAQVSEGAGAATTILVEPRVPGAVGGTGVPLDLDLALAARQKVIGRRMALAGGLRPETVARAIALVSPDIVDVSSGVESSPGLKDADRLARFLEAVR